MMIRIFALGLLMGFIAGLYLNITEATQMYPFLMKEVDRLDKQYNLDTVRIENLEYQLLQCRQLVRK